MDRAALLPILRDALLTSAPEIRDALVDVCLIGFDSLTARGQQAFGRVLWQLLRERLSGTERAAENVALLDAVIELITVDVPRALLPREAVFERDNWACRYCETPITLDSGQVDHVVPRSRGGSDDMGNLAAACRRCNASKKDRTPDEWRAAGGLRS